jgi:hypothetical protein
MAKEHGHRYDTDVRWFSSDCAMSCERIRNRPIADINGKYSVTFLPQPCVGNSSSVIKSRDYVEVGTKVVNIVMKEYPNFWTKWYW